MKPKPLSPYAAALVQRAISVQLDSLITEYGAAIVIDAAADSLTAAAAEATARKHHQRAGTYTAIADALRDAAQAITSIGKP